MIRNLKVVNKNNETVDIVLVVGRMGADPKIQKLNTKYGEAIKAGNTSIFVDFYNKDMTPERQAELDEKNGSFKKSRKIDTEVFNVEYWSNSNAENFAKLAKKGSEVLLIGKVIEPTQESISKGYDRRTIRITSFDIIRYAKKNQNDTNVSQAEAPAEDTTVEQAPVAKPQDNSPVEVDVQYVEDIDIDDLLAS